MANTIEDLVDYVGGAVSEIDRLNAEIDRLREMHRDMCGVAGKYIEENERLLAALDEVCDIALGSDLGPEYAIRVRQIRALNQQSTAEK